jgi:hypothetical protein
MNLREEHKQYEIKIELDKDRYDALLDICRNYKAQHSTDITPTEYVLMLIDSAIGKK